MNRGLLGLDVLGELILGGWAPGQESIDDRLLVQMEEVARDGTGGEFRRLVFVLAEIVLRYIETCRRVFGLTTAQVTGQWDLETAQGAQLDVLGSIVGLPRRGFLDDRYRTFLRMQIQLILSAPGVDGRWTGTAENILAITRTFLGGTPGDGDIKLFNAPPYSYILDIQDITLPDLDLLAYFLCRAQYAGVIGNLYVALDDDHRNWDSDTAGSAIPDVGVWGSDTPGSAIANVLIWGTHVAIGGEGLDC